MSQLNIGSIGGVEKVSEIKDVQQLKSYIMQLTEQLRYVLNNLGAENFNDAALTELQGQTADQVKKTVNDAMGNYSTRKQTAEMISQEVAIVDGKVTQLEQTAEEIAAKAEDAQGNASEALQTATELTSRVEDAEDNASEAKQTASALTSRVTAAEGNASEALQTATGLTSRVEDAEDNASEAMQTAQQLSNRVTAAEGDASQALQTASSLSSRVTSAEGNASQALQTANSLSYSVSNLSGRVSVLEQTDMSVAIKLRDPSVNSNFEVRVANQSAPMHGGTHTFYGMALRQNGVTQGGLYAYNNALLLASGDMLMTTSAGSLYFGPHPSSGRYGMICSMDLLPQTGDLYCLGGDGNGQRWKRLYTNNSVSVSDRREKHDIAPLDVPGLLEKLRPVRYRLNEEKEGKLRFGFVAQEVEEAIKGTDYSDAAVLMNDNPEHLGLLYAELIAPLVDGWQRHEREIADLRSRIKQLEGMLEGDGK